MVERLINNIPSVPARKFAAAVVIVGSALVIAGSGFGIGWTLRKAEDKEDAKHDVEVADRAALKVEEQMVRDLKLLLSCQQVQEQKK